MALVVLPESPRWLVVQGKLDAALAAMHRIHTSTHLPAGVPLPRAFPLTASTVCKPSTACGRLRVYGCCRESVSLQPREASGGETAAGKRHRGSGRSGCERQTGGVRERNRVGKQGISVCRGEGGEGSTWREGCACRCTAWEEGGVSGAGGCAGQHGSTAEVEAELLELWSNVEKERAEAQSRGAALQRPPLSRKVG